MTESTYVKMFRGAFINMLRWKQFDALWERLHHEQNDWYVYELEAEVPEQTLEKTQWKAFLDAFSIKIREQHGEDYCGIVYVDNPEHPTYIKIYDPNNLGVVCGISDMPPPLPGWILSQEPPNKINRDIFIVIKRKPWWKFLWKK